MEENKDEILEELRSEELHEEQDLYEENNIDELEQDSSTEGDSAQRIKTLGRTALSSVKATFAIVTNPIFWAVVVVVLLLAFAISGSKVMGKSDYNIQCGPSGISYISISDNADDFTRQSAIASWLTSTQFDVFGGPLSKEQAAGVIGNFIIESSGANPKVVETLSLSNPDYYKNVSNDDVLSWGSVGGKAIGIAQWDSGRRVNLVNFAKSKGKDWHDLNTQLEFLKGELESAEGMRLVNGGFNNKTHTPDEYARLWNRIFERSAGDDNSPHVTKRKNAAKEFFSEYKGAGAFSSNCTGGSIDTSNIVQLAIQSSYGLWDRAAWQNCTVVTNCGMTFSKPEYIEAKRVAEEKSTPDPGRGLLASCDRFVATMLRATGADLDFPWGAVVHQQQYMESSPKWKRVSCTERLPGDVIVAPGKHIMLYLGIHEGQEVLASASYLERTASLMPVSCNGSNWNADSYSNAEGWRLVQ